MSRRSQMLLCSLVWFSRVAAVLVGELFGATNFAAETVEFHGTTAADLQTEMLRMSSRGGRISLPPGLTLNCPMREDLIAGEKSPHALLVPDRVELDLNGGSLVLDLRSNGYGVRLANHSVIRNGTIRVAHSEQKGSQGCWHSAISVGAAYGDGGTPEKPGHFTQVSHWTIDQMTIDQQVEACAIQLMSEACHGTIRNVTILDSSKALLGIGMDWGSVGPIMTADDQMPRMKELWDQKQIYSTHPHDITIENIRIGRLTRNQDANDAGIRCSACHRVSIKNVEIEEAACAVAIWGGDLGYEFAPNDQYAVAHTGYHIENVTIRKAQRFGLVLNGSSDNVFRARRDLSYQPRRDPLKPGITKPVLKNISLTAGDIPEAQGLYAVAVSKAQFESVRFEGFKIGVHAEDAVDGMHFRRTEFINVIDKAKIQGATVPARDVTFDPILD